MTRETGLEWNLGECQQYRPGRRAWTYREAAKELGGRGRKLQSEAQEARGQGFPLEEGMPVSAESGMPQQA